MKQGVLTPDHRALEDELADVQDIIKNLHGAVSTATGFSAIIPHPNSVGAEVDTDTTKRFLSLIDEQLERAETELERILLTWWPRPVVLADRQRPHTYARGKQKKADEQKRPKAAV